MSSTFLGLNTAYTGLQSYMAALNTTAHNVSNSKTTGYTRQQVLMRADRALTYASYGTIGTGSIVTGIEQTRDSYYDVKYRNNQSNLGQYEVLENYMTQIEDYLNDYALEGMTTLYDNLYDSLHELKKTPSDDTVKNNVVNAGMALAEYFNTLTVNLRKIQVDANEEIKNKCEQINTMAANIAGLNKQINIIEANGGTANDLRDQRNVLLDELAKIANISTTEYEVGNGVTNLTVTLDGQYLVDNYNYNTLITEAKTERRNASDAEGMYEITWSNGISFSEYSDTLGGELKALLDIRDGCNNAYEVVNQTTDAAGNPVYELGTEQRTGVTNTSYKGVPYYQTKINQFVNLLSDVFNSVFTSGYTTEGEPGIEFFTIKYSDSPMSALSIEVNPELINNVSRLATTTDWTSGEANSDLVEKLIETQEQKLFNGGTGAYFLESIIAAVAVDSDRASTFSTNYANLETTIENQRLSIMGVDEDEEGVDLVKFQQAYNLCSKMIQTFSEIYNKLINETGV